VASRAVLSSTELVIAKVMGNHMHGFQCNGIYIYNIVAFIIYWSYMLVHLKRISDIHELKKAFVTVRIAVLFNNLIELKIRIAVFFYVYF
jgi:hypothetical protein